MKPGVDVEQTIHFSPGRHEPTSGEMCFMEAVAVLTGDPWSDSPPSVCPVIAAFCRVWNDGLDDNERTPRLRPLLTQVIGTRDEPAVQDTRALMMADWAIRVYAPAWLRAAGCGDVAEELGALLPLRNVRSIPHIVRLLGRAKAQAERMWENGIDDATEAVAASAGDAAWMAAQQAATASVASVAGEIAWMAAGDVAWTAAWGAVGTRAPDIIERQIRYLQDSAIGLLGRIISLGVETSPLSTA